MHELALAEAMLEAAHAAAAAHALSRVKTVRVVVGAFAACPDALRFAWEACRGRFPSLENAELEIEEVSGLELRMDYLEGEGEP